MQTQKFGIVVFFVLIQSVMLAQNTGIGTAAPTKKLSVAGSIAVDHDNANRGTPDSAALVFGTQLPLVAISSNKTAGEENPNGLDFWAGGYKRMSISPDGNVAVSGGSPDAASKLFVAGHLRSYSFQTNNSNIGNSIGSSLTLSSQLSVNGNPFNAAYKFTVNNGPSYFGGNALVKGHFTADSNVNVNGNVNVDDQVIVGGDVVSYQEVRGESLRATQNMAVGGSIDNAYRLRVWDGHARFGGNLHATGKMAVGGDLDENYNLRVYGGPSRFGGDVQVTGNLDVDQIKGTGVVRSAGPSSLRIGFHAISLNYTLNALDEIDVTASISDFEGGNNDVRVFVSQFVPDPLPQYINWNHFNFLVHSIDATTNTCKVRVVNTVNFQLSIKGTLYLTSIVKD